MSVIKRNIMFDIRFPENYWYEDMITKSLIYSKCKNIHCIEDCLYYYRQHQKSTSNKVSHTRDYKCLCQYYLPRYIIKYASDINLNIDDIFKFTIMREFEAISFKRLSGLPNNIKKMIFYLNSKLVQSFDLKEIQDMSWLDKYYLNAFEKENYILYTLISLLKKWS